MRLEEGIHRPFHCPLVQYCLLFVSVGLAAVVAAAGEAMAVDQRKLIEFHRWSD